MAKVQAPLFGFGASGTIGKSITFAGWKGVPYARQRVTPSNPRSVEQTKTRNMFSAMSGAFKASPAQVKLPWQDAVQGKPKTARNAFLGDNLAVLRGATSLLGILASPGTRSAPSLGAVSAIAGSGSAEINVTYGTPALPDQWTLDAAHFALIEEDDPTNVTEWEWTYSTDPAPAGSSTLTAPAGSTAYAVIVWLEFSRPDGQVAYSRSKSVIATSAA